MHPAPARTWHEIALKLSELMEKFKTLIIVCMRQDEIFNEPLKHNASQLLIKQAINFAQSGHLGIIPITFRQLKARSLMPGFSSRQAAHNCQMYS